MVKSYKRAGGYLKCALCHSGAICVQFRNHRRVSNDRSGPDEGDHAEAIEVGPVPEVLGHAEAGVLLAIWQSGVTSSTVSFSLAPGQLGALECEHSRGLLAAAAAGL